MSIVEAIGRFKELDPSTLHDRIRSGEIDRYDLLANIPSPSRRGGVLICGREALIRFHRIASRSVKKQRDQADFDVSEVAAYLRGHLLRDLQTDFPGDDEARIAAILDRTIARLRRRTHRQLTHFVPCSVTSATDPATFQIGPVVFERRNTFFARMKSAIEEHGRVSRRRSLRLSSRVPEALKRFSTGPASNEDVMAKKFVEYASHFEWMATIEVPPCAPSVSLKRAELAVDTALDVIKHLVRMKFAARIRTGFNRGRTPEISRMTADPSGCVNFGWSRTAEGALLEPGWFDEVRTGIPHHLAVASSLIESCVAPPPRGFVHQWLLDALTLFAAGVAQDLPSTQLVMFAAALERLSVLDRGQVRRQFTVRTALLAYEGDTADLVPTLKRAASVYSVRSDVVHGAISPFDARPTKLLNTAHELAQTALFRAFEIANVLLTKFGPAASSSDLRRFYKGVEQRYRPILEPLVGPEYFTA